MGKTHPAEFVCNAPTILELPREIVKGEDMLMNIRLAFATDKPARVIPAQVYLYRNNDESVVHTVPSYRSLRGDVRPFSYRFHPA